MFVRYAHSNYYLLISIYYLWRAYKLDKLISKTCC